MEKTGLTRKVNLLKSFIRVTSFVKFDMLRISKKLKVECKVTETLRFKKKKKNGTVTP